MSLRGVDAQVLLPRSMDISRSESNLSYKSGAEQQQFAEFFQKKTQEISKQVIETSKTDKNNIDKNGKANEDESKQKKKRKANATNITSIAKQTQNKGTSSMYDVSI